MKQYESYKDSGIEWLGKIPSHWDAMKLKYVCQITDGTHYSPGIKSEGMPYITVSNVNNGIIDIDNANKISVEEYEELVKQGCQPQTGDVLLAKDGTVGRTAIVTNNKYVVLSSLGILHPLDNIHSSFLKYSLDSHFLQEQMAAAMAGSALRRITISKICEFVSTVPSLSEQRIIATYLDDKVSKIDSIIAEKEKMVEDLQNYRKSIISETVTRGLNPNVPMKDSGVKWIGMIPEHWTVSKIKNVLEHSDNNLRVGPFGSSLSGNDFVNQGYWVYNQRVVLDNNFSKNDTFITEEKYEELSSFRVFEGDFLLTTRGTIGKVTIVPHTYHEGILHPCIIRFRIDDSKVRKDFLKYIFNDTELIANQVKFNSNSTTIDVIYSYTLKELQISMPPVNEQDCIIKFLKNKTPQIDNSIFELQSQIEDLKSFKSSLITEAVTGKIDLRNS